MSPLMPSRWPFRIRPLLLLALLPAALAAALAPAALAAPGAAAPLSEDDLVKLVALGLDDAVIVTRIDKAGLSFRADEAALQRLKKAGASAAVLAAVWKEE